MSHESTKETLRGVGFTTPTLFSEDGEAVLTDEIRRHVRSLGDLGAELFVPCGNTGEYYALTDRERVDVVEATADAAGPDATVVGGIGGSTKTAKKLAAEYESAGADAVMVMHPSHTYLNESGLLDYYRKIADSTDLGVVVYKRGPEVTDHILEELSEVDNVVGIKYAVNDVESFSNAVRNVDGSVVWITGVAERFAPTYALEGAEGFTTGIGNFVPEVTLELYDALTSDDWERAMHIRDGLRPLETLRDETDDQPVFSASKNVPVVKYGMELRGFYGGPAREPLEELSPSDEKRVERSFERITDRSPNVNRG